jgi:hypothetical protein
MNNQELIKLRNEIMDCFTCDEEIMEGGDSVIAGRVDDVLSKLNRIPSEIADLFDYSFSDTDLNLHWKNIVKNTFEISGIYLYHDRIKNNHFYDKYDDIIHNNTDTVYCTRFTDSRIGYFINYSSSTRTFPENVRQEDRHIVMVVTAICDNKLLDFLPIGDISNLSMFNHTLSVFHDHCVSISQDVEMDRKFVYVNNIGVKAGRAELTTGKSYYIPSFYSMYEQETIRNNLSDICDEKSKFTTTRIMYDELVYDVNTDERTEKWLLELQYHGLLYDNKLDASYRAKAMLGVRPFHDIDYN